MHIGILKVAAVLEEAGHGVDVLDLSGVANPLDVIDDYLKERDINTIGWSATTPQMFTGRKIAEHIRSIRPDVKLILGGAHPTVTTAAMKREKKKGLYGRAQAAYEKLFEVADVVVAGDGEDSVEYSLTAPKGTLVDADDPDGGFFLTTQRLGELPFPARHLVDMESYHYYIKGQKSASLIGQLGCPMPCRFCSGRYSPSFRRARPRPISNVIAELRHLYEVYGFRAFQMYDDELNLSPAFLSDLREIIKFRDELGVDLYFRGFIKSHLFTEDQAKLMKECGFAEICIGYESGSERILANIKKQSTKAQNSRCVELTKKYGIRTKAFMSFCHPGESPETAQETCDWLINMEVEDFDCTVISPFPGCPLYDDSIPHDEKAGIWKYITPENGDVLYSLDVDYTNTMQYFKGDKNLGYTSFVYTDHLNRDDVVQLRDWIEDTVRQKLKIPYYETKAAMLYDHSMGQIPLHILRSSNETDGTSKGVVIGPSVLDTTIESPIGDI